MLRNKTTIIVGLPERLTALHISATLAELNLVLHADRPRVIFDLSDVKEMDSAGTEMLLHCLEQISHGDGQLALAAVPPHIMVVLELTSLSVVFDIFDSGDEAMNSFGAALPRAA